MYKQSQNARKRAERQARPLWADLGKMRAIYAHAEELRAAGQNVQVDHIVPLRSPVVCGLDCEFNLRLLSAGENSAKSNQLQQDLPGFRVPSPEEFVLC